MSLIRFGIRTIITDNYILRNTKSLLELTCRMPIIGSVNSDQRRRQRLKSLRGEGNSHTWACERVCTVGRSEVSRRRRTCRVDGRPSARCRDRFQSRSTVTPSRSSQSGSESTASTQTCSQRAHLEDGKLQLVSRLIMAVWMDVFVTWAGVMIVAYYL